MSSTRKPTKKVSIYTVAEAAGVSYGTVSRALNNRPEVKPETRQRVLEVARQLGYVPDPIARGLSMRLTSAFGILIPGITDPFFMPIAQGIEQVAREIGYATLLHDTGRSSTAMLAGVTTFMHFRVSGVVILGGAQDLDEQIADHLDDIPTVVVLRAAKHGLFPAVYFDHAAGARAVVSHLLATGRRRIGFVAGTDNSVAAQERWQGYSEALVAAGYAVDPALIAQGHFTMEGGARGTKDLIARTPSHRPDAIFYASDTMALAGMHQLHQAGIRIPDDIAVAGYGNVSFAAISEPPLTTVGVAKGQLGQCAGQLLRQMLESPGQRPADVTLDTELIVRASSAPF
jgi:LacI family transcriptional regulator